ncbi:MAG: hypothetical protein M3450_03400 [Actinomycetota bacterium]|nr:hypothetical protein [Actinomycetota bacterium]
MLGMRQAVPESEILIFTAADELANCAYLYVRAEVMTPVVLDFFALHIEAETTGAHF